MSDKNQFIQSQLKRYGIDVTTEMKKIIKDKDARVSDELLESITFKVLSDNSLELMMRKYGPFIDMGSGRGYSFGRKKVMHETRKLRYGLRSAKKFYSPVAYGHLSNLIGRLSYGYAQQIIKDMKQAIN